MANKSDMQCTSSSDEDLNIMNSVEDSVIPQCEGIPRRNWIGKCVVRHNASGIVVAEQICHNVNLDVVIGSLGPLGGTHVAVQILSILFEDDVLDEWRYSV